MHHGMDTMCATTTTAPDQHAERTKQAAARNSIFKAPANPEPTLSITHQRIYKAEYTDESAKGRISGQFTLTPPSSPENGAALHGNVYAEFKTGAEVRKVAETLRLAANDLDRQNGVDPVSEEAEDQPNYDRRVIGTVAVCSIGKVGVVTDYVKLPWGWSYIGFNVDNGQKWASRQPVLLAANLGEFIARKVNQARTAASEGRC